MPTFHNPTLKSTPYRSGSSNPRNPRLQTAPAVPSLTFPPQMGIQMPGAAATLRSVQEWFLGVEYPPADTAEVEAASLHWVDPDARIARMAVRTTVRVGNRLMSHTSIVEGRLDGRFQLAGRTLQALRFV